MKLIRFLRKCRGERVRVETKDGQKIEGTIANVDKTMNVELSKVSINNTLVDSYTIRGSSIRYVIFRDDIDFKPLLVDDRPKNKSKLGAGDTVKRRKTNV